MNQKWEEMYRKKLGSADDCVKYLNDDDGILIPLGNGAPAALGNAIGKRIREGNLKGLTWVGGLDVKWMDILSPELQDRITIDSGFVAEAVRLGVQKGLYTYSPNRLGHVIDVVTQHRAHLNKGAVVCVVSPMDEHGFFSTGTNVDIGWGSAKSGVFREILLEVNENMPRAFGNNHIHISEVTAVCENTAPLVEMPPVPTSKEDEMIGEYVAELIPDGACLQIGIGGMPNAIANCLKAKKDLGIHSEMLTDSMVDLYECGAVTCARKNINRFKMVGCFAFGTQKLYKFIDNNPMVEMHCTSYVNDPYVIGQHDNMIAVNGTIEVDLSGQAASESHGPIQYSGAGGQSDFVQGAWRSHGGQSFLTLHSTYVDKNGERHSNINPMLTPGAFVSTTRQDVENIVTEYGVAHVKGNDMRTRVKDLIRIAHPDFRDWLRSEAQRLRYIP